MLSRRLLILSACLVLAASKPLSEEDDETERPPKPTEKPDVDPTNPTVPPSIIGNLLENTLYIPITDLNGKIVGYYTYIPNFQQIVAFPYGFNGQILQSLHQKGLYPIYDIFGRFWGFFATSIGGSKEPKDLKTLATNLYIHGLYPVQNGKGQIIAIYKLHRQYPVGYHINFQSNQGPDV